MTFCLFWLFTPNIKIQLICACLICSCLLNTLSWRDLTFLLLLSASCSSSNPTGEMSTRSTFSTIPIWEFSLPNHSSETGASTSPKGILICQVQLPHLSLPSLSFSDCSDTPVWSPSFAVSLLPLTSLTASHHLYPTFLKQGSPQELPLPPAFLLIVVSIFLNDMKRDFNYFHW